MRSSSTRVGQLSPPTYVPFIPGGEDRHNGYNRTARLVQALCGEDVKYPASIRMESRVPQRLWPSVTFTLNMRAWVLSHFSHVWLCVTYGQSFPGSSVHDSSGMNTGVDCRALLHCWIIGGRGIKVNRTLELSSSLAYLWAHSPWFPMTWVQP